MTTPRHKFIASLITIRLHLRRFYRSCSYPPPLPPLSQAPSPRSHGRIPAPLPARPRDSHPKQNILPPLLFILALLPRLYRISYPPSVVFDEVHFLRFTSGYYNRKYFFDIHPPLGKLIFALITYLFCGAPHLQYELNGEDFGDQSYIPLRVTSALFGAAVSPITFLICRTLGLSLPASLLPAFIQAFDHLSVIEGRLVLCDAQLMFFMALCLLCALRMWRAPPYARTPWVIATAVTGAAALSVKWTALVTPALVAIVSLTGHPFTKRRLASNHIVLAAITALALYTACFWLHFRILIYSGMGDPFMKLSFQRTLIGGKSYSPNAISDGFLHNFVFLNKQMYIANKGIKARHRWESRWWQWMINMRGLLYYNELNADNKMLNEKIYLIINPVVTAVTLASLLVFVGICVAVFIRKRDQSEKPTRSLNLQAFIARGSFFLAAYVLNLLPYLGKQKPSRFLHHCHVTRISRSHPP